MLVRSRTDGVSEALLTSDLQSALHHIFPEVVDSLAGVPSPVKQARFADVQSQHPLVVLHQELGVTFDHHIVLHPNDLWLRSNVLEEERYAVWRRGGEGWGVSAGDVGAGGGEKMEG